MGVRRLGSKHRTRTADVLQVYKIAILKNRSLASRRRAAQPLRVAVLHRAFWLGLKQQKGCALQRATPPLDVGRMERAGLSARQIDCSTGDLPPSPDPKPDGRHGASVGDHPQEGAPPLDGCAPITSAAEIAAAEAGVTSAGSESDVHAVSFDDWE
mmetsp:Transcript_36968/g.96861  ORF Transcript_36968/g.96861 Transcript_36968/m.96861 type:complete len:156 (+) Transcript_36968:256-723(+)